MKINDEDKNFQEIKKLIKLEQEAAFKIFDQKEFSSQLDKRIKAKPAKISFIPVLLKKPVYSLVALIILISVIIVSLIHIIPTSSSKNNFLELRNLFSNIPVLQKNVSILKVQNDLTDDQILRTELKWIIKSTFYSIKKKEYSKEEITGIFERILKGDKSGGEIKHETKTIYERGTA